MKYNQALSKAAAICSRQERCISDIMKKLRTWELMEEECNNIVEYLINEKYIDEQRYANYYVRDKFRFNGWGKIKIRFHLKQKEITEEHINIALEEINEQEYLLKLTKILEGKLKQVKNKDYWQTKAALYRLGQTRGFEAFLVSQCIDKLLNESC